MRKISRSSLIAAVAATMAVAFAACGEPETKEQSSGADDGPAELSEPPQLPARPITLNVIDGGGDLQLSQPAIDEFVKDNPKLVSKVTYSKSTGPELTGKIQAGQRAGKAQYNLVVAGYGEIATGAQQGLWQRLLPNYGLAPNAEQAVRELRLSHWRGELPQLTVKLNWAYRKFEHIFGSFTYRGAPVHGFKTTSTGQPLDTFGRNLYVDTYDSAYGAGWKRENSFLMHKGSGKFCYGFYGHGARPVGAGTHYRATIIGPGVTPDIHWESDSLGIYDQAFDLQRHEEQKSFYAGDGLCKAV